MSLWIIITIIIYGYIHVYYALVKGYVGQSRTDVVCPHKEFVIRSPIIAQPSHMAWIWPYLQRTHNMSGIQQVLRYSIPTTTVCCSDDLAIEVVWKWCFTTTTAKTTKTCSKMKVATKIKFCVKWFHFNCVLCPASLSVAAVVFFFCSSTSRRSIHITIDYVVSVYVDAVGRMLLIPGLKWPPWTDWFIMSVLLCSDSGSPLLTSSRQTDRQQARNDGLLWLESGCRSASEGPFFWETHN